MSISFACGFCSRKYTVADALAGKTVKCKECGRDILIASPRAAQPRPKAPQKDLYAPEDEAPLPAPRRPGAIPSEAPSKKKKRKSGGGVSGYSVAGGILAFLAILRITIKVLELTGVVGPQFQRAAPDAPPAAIGAPSPPVDSQPRPYEMGDDSFGRIQIGGGRASARNDQFRGEGVAFEIDYQVESRGEGEGAGVFNLVLKSSNRQVKMYQFLKDSGTIKTFSTDYRMSDGPFEAFFVTFVRGKWARVSEIVPLSGP